VISKLKDAVTNFKRSKEYGKNLFQCKSKKENKSNSLLKREDSIDKNNYYQFHKTINNSDYLTILLEIKKENKTYVSIAKEFNLSPKQVSTIAKKLREYKVFISEVEKVVELQKDIKSNKKVIKKTIKKDIKPKDIKPKEIKKDSSHKFHKTIDNIDYYSILKELIEAKESQAKICEKYNITIKQAYLIKKKHKNGEVTLDMVVNVINKDNNNYNILKELIDTVDDLNEKIIKKDIKPKEIKKDNKNTKTVKSVITTSKKYFFFHKTIDNVRYYNILKELIEAKESQAKICEKYNITIKQAYLIKKKHKNGEVTLDMVGKMIGI
jgi:Trp operon repressor